MPRQINIKKGKQPASRKSDAKSFGTPTSKVTKRKSMNSSNDRSQRNATNSSNDNSNSNSTRTSSSGSSSSSFIRIGKYKITFPIKQMMEMKKLQESTKFLIPKRPFGRYVKEVMQEQSGSADLRIQEQALEALQTAAEMHLTNYFEYSNLCCLHGKRVTLKPVDMTLFHSILEPYVPCMQI